MIHTSPADDVDVLVVGAGPTGLTAALALHAAGVDVRIVDRTPGPVEESRAVVVHARTLELWAKLGLADAMVAEGRPVRGARSLYDRRPVGGGGLVLDITRAGRGRTPYPYVLVLGQDRVERLLVDALAERGVHVERRAEAVALAAGPDAVDVTLTGGAVRARYVVGADGAHSLVRTAAGIPFEGDRYGGTFFLADVAVDGPVAHDALTVALGSRGEFVLLVPMADRPGEAGSRFRVFGTLAAGSVSALTLEQAQAEVDRVTGLATRLRDPRWTSVYRLQHRRAARFREGRVLLAGDAAHVHSPVGGQGMNTGVQDAFDLSWMLSAVVHGHAPDDLLDAYDAERTPVARALLRGTDAGFTTVTGAGARAQRLRRAALAVLPRAVRVPVLAHRLFDTVAMIGVAYPESPVVAGDRSRRARPGDRLPHALLADGAALFDLLTGPAHHLLLVAGRDPLDAGLAGSLRGVVAASALPVAVHELGPGEAGVRRAVGVRTPTALLVRPDGHVAWRGALADAEGLRRYLNRWYRPAVDGGRVARPDVGRHAESTGVLLERQGGVS